MIVGCSSMGCWSGIEDRGGFVEFKSEVIVSLRVLEFLSSFVDLLFDLIFESVSVSLLFTLLFDIFKIVNKIIIITIE